MQPHVGIEEASLPTACVLLEDHMRAQSYLVRISLMYVKYGVLFFAGPLFLNPTYNSNASASGSKMCAACTYYLPHLVLPVSIVYL